MLGSIIHRMQGARTSLGLLTLSQHITMLTCFQHAFFSVRKVRKTESHVVVQRCIFAGTTGPENG